MVMSTLHDGSAVKWSIKWKLISIITILIVLLVATLSYMQVTSQKRIMENDLDNRITLMKENLIERGKSFVINLSQQVENDIASFNLFRVTEVVKESVKNNREIKYAVLMDSTGKAIIHTQKPGLVQTVLAGIHDREALNQKKLTVMIYNDGNESIVEIVQPIQISTEPWGVLRLGYSLAHLEGEIDIFRRQIREEINKMIYRSIVTSSGILVICLVIVFLLSTRISKPLIYLTESARKISKGDFTISSEVPIRSRDEVGVLSETFFKMSRDLRDSYRRLEEYNKNLEEKVAERTAELKLALTDTAEARDRIDGIVKSVADGLVVTDIYNRVVLMNRPAEDLLGVRLSEVIDRPIDFAIKDEMIRDRVMSTLDKKKSGYEFDFELPENDSKHPRIMRARTSVMYDKEGRQTGMVTIIHDVTHEREVDRMKTEFISTAAHELRTPLTSIQGFSEIMLTRDDLSEQEKKKFLNYINKQAVSLTNIVGDLLDIARIESERGFSITKVPYTIDDIIHQVVPYFQEHSKKHIFEVILPEKQVKLLMDKQKIEQVVKNLMSNAIKYSPNGGLIKVTGTSSADFYEISIADQGIGMTPEQTEKIFDKFYRVDASNTAIEGTGLGMTIVKYIIEAHGGNIWVESEIGKGTQIRFTIPA
jgi:PAS domain S-box-containing protein